MHAGLQFGARYVARAAEAIRHLSFNSVTFGDADPCGDTQQDAGLQDSAWRQLRISEAGKALICGLCIKDHFFHLAHAFINCMQSSKKAPNVRRELQKVYEHCAEVAFGDRIKSHEAGYSPASLDSVIEVSISYQWLSDLNRSKTFTKDLSARRTLCGSMATEQLRNQETTAAGTCLNVWACLRHMPKEHQQQQIASLDAPPAAPQVRNCMRANAA